VAQNHTRSSNNLTFYTYRAQLTFGLSKACKEVNIAELFLQWLDKSSSLLSNFGILPFDAKKGQQTTDRSQVALDDVEFFGTHYYNHRVLQQRNLTGMVHFQTSSPWRSIKHIKSPYFTWMKACKVFLNYTKFETYTLVACGFMVGAHPGHLCCQEAEEKLRGSLALDDDELEFQLSSRSISVPISDGDSGRYSLQAMVVETSVSSTQKPRERFYSLESPSTAATNYPYRGMYQFVPMLKSVEWPISKIYQLAQWHIRIINSLKPIYVEKPP
jgi:hypothetical protein